MLLDWDAEGEKMKRIKDRFDPAEEVRIVGHETDLRFSIAGREGVVDDGHLNMPGGEVFYCPVEDSTEGVVTFSEFPAVQEPDVVDGVRMRYENGRVVEASATSNEEALMRALDRDEGARVLGEFGIGCNPGIQRHMKNTLFDEKMYGTIHLAVGAGIPIAGGTNQSATHWDMVKDLRSGGRIELDGEVVQENVRDDPPRHRRRDPDRGRPQRERHALGHGQGPAERRPDRARRRGRAGERGVDVLGRSAKRAHGPGEQQRLGAQVGEPDGREVADPLDAEKARAAIPGRTCR